MAITLRKCLRWICTTLLWRFLRSVAFWIAYSKGGKTPQKVSSDVHTDNFLRLLDNILGPMRIICPIPFVIITSRPRAKAGPISCSLRESAKVYPYIRAHTLLNALQGRIDDRPLVLFYPGTFTRSATSGSVMSLFNCLPGDNYYRAQNLREMSVQLEA